MEKLNDRQRRFAELIVAGESAKAAYFKSFPRCKSDKTASSEGHKLQKKPHVAAFIAKYRAEIAERTKSELIATKEQVLQFLTEVMMTPGGKVTKDSRLCQAYKDTPDTNEIKMPDKIRAAERMSKILGWDAAEKHEVEAGDDLKALLLELRRGGKPEIQ